LAVRKCAQKKESVKICTSSTWRSYSHYISQKFVISILTALKIVRKEDLNDICIVLTRTLNT
jgi:hypothetical protein